MRQNENAVAVFLKNKRVRNKQIIDNGHLIPSAQEKELDVKYFPRLDVPLCIQLNITSQLIIGTRLFLTRVSKAIQVLQIFD